MSERQIKEFLMYQKVCRQNANKNGTIFDNFDVKDAQLKEINFCIKNKRCDLNWKRISIFIKLLEVFC